MKKIYYISSIFLGYLILVSATSKPVVERGPYLQQITPTEIVIRWRIGLADSNVDSIHFGASPDNLSRVITDNRKVIVDFDCGPLCSKQLLEKEVHLSGLTPNTRYYYGIGPSTSPLNQHEARGHFSTSPHHGSIKPLRVWVLGDSGTGSSSARKVKESYLFYTGLRGTDLLLTLGDNAYQSGLDREYQKKFFDIYPDVLRNTPVWPCLGNHDSISSDSPTQTGPYFDMFTLPTQGEAGGFASGTEAYYSFDYANVHFICLDSSDSSRAPDGPMLTWLRNDLTSTRQEWVIAFWHHPPYTKIGHDSDKGSRYKQMRKYILPVLEKSGVDLVLAGHSHAYQRSFFINGHYGKSPEIAKNPALIKNLGNGIPFPAPAADGAYTKKFVRGKKNGHGGTVYVVAGSSGQFYGGDSRHPAMHTTLLEMGSMVLDIFGNRLDAVFLDSKNTIRDRFSIVHEPDKIPPVIYSVKILNSTTLQILFSEPLKKKSAERTTHYSINNGIKVLSARRSVDGRSVFLALSHLTPNKNYLLTVKGIKDLGFRNSISGLGAQASFYFPEVMPSGFSIKQTR